MAKILIIEDDADMAAVIADWLGYEHHSVESVLRGDEGLHLLKTSNYDLVVLDWDLPAVSGLEISKTIRSMSNDTLVLMLTGKNKLKDKETGLDSGADDYLTKPFHMRELSARIRALLRRAGKSSPNILTSGDITLDPQSYRVSRSGVEIHLLPKEFALLEFLMRHPGEVYSAEALLAHVWHSESDASLDAIRTCFKRLRKKIDNPDGSSIIRTIHGIGYSLQA